MVSPEEDETDLTTNSQVDKVVMPYFTHHGSRYGFVSSQKIAQHVLMIR